MHVSYAFCTCNEAGSCLGCPLDIGCNKIEECDMDIYERDFYIFAMKIFEVGSFLHCMLPLIFEGVDGQNMAMGKVEELFEGKGFALAIRINHYIFKRTCNENAVFQVISTIVIVPIYFSIFSRFDVNMKFVEFGFLCSLIWGQQFLILS